MTYASDTELRVNRRMTDVFIKTHPQKIAVTLSRETMVNDGAGGWVSGSTSSVAAQEFAFLPSAYQLPVRRTQDGQEVTPEYTMIGRHDAVIEPGDWFWSDGIKYEVVFIHPDRSYQVKAEVMYRG